MRIAQFVNTLDFGGATDYALQLVEGLPEHSHVVYSGPGSDWLDRARATGASVHILADFQPTHIGGGPFGPGDLRCVVELVRRLRSDRVDVLHCYGSKSRLLGMLAGVLARTPVRVQSAHGFSPNPEMSRPLRSVLWVLEWVMALLCTSLIVETEADRRLAERRLPGMGRKLHLVHHGAQAPLVEPGPTRSEVLARLDVPEDALVVLLACRLAERKNPIAVIEAARILRDRGEDAGLCFVIVGEGPLAADLRTRAVREELGVRFTGNRRDIWEVVRAADVLVSPSHWEGLPLVVVNAYLLGTPCIASAVGGIPEVVQHEVTGLLLAEPTGEALAAALSTAATRPEVLAEWGRAGGRLVRGRYDRGRMLGAHRDIYLGGRG